MGSRMHVNHTGCPDHIGSGGGRRRGRRRRAIGRAPLRRLLLGPRGATLSGHFGRKGVAAVHAPQRRGRGAGARGTVGGAGGFGRDGHIPSQAAILAETVRTATGTGDGPSNPPTVLGGGGGGSDSGTTTGGGGGGGNTRGAQRTARSAGFDSLDGLLVGGSAVHAKQEVILVFDQEDQDILTQLVLIGRHVMLGMGEHAGLEDGGEVGGGHAVLIGLGGKDGQEIENVEQQLLVERGQVANQLLVGGDGFGMVVGFGLGGGDDSAGLGLIDAQGLAKLLVRVQGHDWLGELVEIAPEDVGGIVDGIAGPIQAFSVALGRIEDLLQVFDALRGAVEAKDAFHVGSCHPLVSEGPGTNHQTSAPFSLRKTPHFATTMGT